MASFVIFPIEGVYQKDARPDVSVIVPLYKSKSVVRDQIQRWVQDKGLVVEIVYVDDLCPQKSGWEAFKQWNRRPDKKDFLVKIVMSDTNRGFGQACNLGAFHATGKKLIFLNADTVTTPNWVRPLIEPLEDPSVGIVGNLQLKEGGDLHGTIDSAGSEWSWEHSNFFHVGRHIYNGKLLEQPYTPDDAPPDMLRLSEREMVTGCCFSIRSDLYRTIGGFNYFYKVGYWEDSELCMTVRELGYKILFQPDSVVYHKLSHSNASEQNSHFKNRELFFNKWVHSGRIDPLVGAKRNVPNTKISNILVVRRAARGDVLLAASVLPVIHAKHPDAKIYFLTDPACEGVLKGNPYIHQVVNEIQATKHIYHWVCNLDLAYERRPHAKILEAYAVEAGVRVDDCQPYVATEPFDGLPNKYVVFHAGQTGWVGRNWREEGFQALGRAFLKKKYKVVSVGGPGDTLIKGSLDLRGATTVQQLAYVIKNAEMFIGIDSMPMHIAQTVGTPGVCFFGSIRPETRIFRDNMHGVTAKGLNCLGCHHAKFAPLTVTNKCATKDLACEWGVSVADFTEIIEREIWDRKS